MTGAASRGRLLALALAAVAVELLALRPVLSSPPGRGTTVRAELPRVS